MVLGRRHGRRLYDERQRRELHLPHLPQMPMRVE
jgi:hypothetical protein